MWSLNSDDDYLPIGCQLLVLVAASVRRDRRNGECLFSAYRVPRHLPQYFQPWQLFRAAQHLALAPKIAKYAGQNGNSK
jgi:hypothetical protein